MSRRDPRLRLVTVELAVLAYVLLGLVTTIVTVTLNGSI